MPSIFLVFRAFFWFLFLFMVALLTIEAVIAIMPWIWKGVTF